MEMRDYFRAEATELIARMTSDLKALQAADPVAADGLWRSLARSAHTLKGASNVMRETAMAATAHTLEDRLAERDAAGSNSVVDLLAEQLESIFKPVQVSPAVAATHMHGAAEVDEQAEAPRAESEDTLRVELSATEALLRAVAEASATVWLLEDTHGGFPRLKETLRAIRRQAKGTSAPSLLTAIDQLETQIRGMRFESRGRTQDLQLRLAEVDRLATGLRLTSVQPMLLRLERTARRAAEAAGVDLEVVLLGGSETADVKLLTGAEEGLSHAVRNAVTHGLQGLGRKGTIRIGVERHGTTLDFFCHDNGRGIETETLRRTAQGKGWMTVPSAAAASRDDLLDLLTQPGFTTCTAVDQAAGRGVGLDVVRTIVERLRGRLSIESTAGNGMRVVMRLPENLQSVQCMILRVGDQEIAVPIADVEHTQRTGQTLVDAGHRIRKEEGDDARTVEIDCGALLHLDGKPAQRKFAVQVRAGSRKTHLLVDAVMRTEEVILGRLPESAQAERWIAGAYRDHAGRPRLLIQPSLLPMETVAHPGTAQAGVAARIPVLVIDDSLTSRMLEETILSSAGYEVDTAESAEEALEMAAHRQYALFLVDVEMAGMNGFDFVRVTRQDARFQSVPVVMVTSLNRPGDRDRGLSLGASEYIVKGNFDQARLLATIAALTAKKVAEA